VWGELVSFSLNTISNFKSYKYKKQGPVKSDFNIMSSKLCFNQYSLKYKFKLFFNVNQNSFLLNQSDKHYLIIISIVDCIRKKLFKYKK